MPPAALVSRGPSSSRSFIFSSIGRKRARLSSTSVFRKFVEAERAVSKSKARAEETLEVAHQLLPTAESTEDATLQSVCRIMGPRIQMLDRLMRGSTEDAKRFFQEVAGNPFDDVCLEDIFSFGALKKTHLAILQACTLDGLDRGMIEFRHVLRHFDKLVSMAEVITECMEAAVSRQAARASRASNP